MDYFSPEDETHSRHLLLSASNPPIFLGKFANLSPVLPHYVSLLAEPVNSDKPESDQHFNFPLLCEEDQFQSVDLPSNISHTSLETDSFYSDLGRWSIMDSWLKFSSLQCSARRPVLWVFLARTGARWRIGGKQTPDMCPLSAARACHGDLWPDNFNWWTQINNFYLQVLPWVR